MSNHERRMVLDEGFERAVALVVEAFLREGFTVEALDAGDLHRLAAPGDQLRFAWLGASLLDREICPSAPAAPVPRCVGCRLCVYELTGSCTLVTAEHQGSSDPVLALHEPLLTERTASALRILAARPSAEAA
jgi:hypothetical protein